MSRIAIMLVALGLAALASSASVKPSTPDLDAKWEDWKALYEKQYSDDAEEMERRMVWEQNLKHISMHNLDHSLGKNTFNMEMNEYGDMRISEVRAIMNGYKGSNTTKAQRGSTFLAPSFMAVPDAVDWRQQGYVTPVKNQGQCNSGWAFSATGSLEGQSFKKTGKLTSLSEQNLVDCSRSYGNHGCQGGMTYQAFEYVMANGGIDSETCYPYQAQEESCGYQASCNTAEVLRFVVVPSGDEDALKTAVATVGPISVAIDTSHLSFHLYHSGVYDEPSCSSSALDHGVLVVGYGTENGKDYWLVKNSWSRDWGLDGYIKMSRNKNNQCGIATSAIFPLV